MKQKKHKKKSQNLSQTDSSGNQQQTSSLNGSNPNYRSSIFSRIFLRANKYHIEGQQSNEFKRKPFELPIQSLDHVSQQTLGFTNQVLYLEQKDTIQLYVPVYSSLKVKNIQQVNIKDLIAKISGVLIINFNIQHLPNEIVDLLKNKVMIQINRGQSFFLKANENDVTTKMTITGHFLKFVVRNSFDVQIYEDIFWSPFQILKLVLTLTFNSIQHPKIQDISEQSSKQSKHNTFYDPKKNYNIRFNSMRNPEKVPINYVSDCRLGVYDLAENLLQSYSSTLPTYDEIKQQFQKSIMQLSGIQKTQEVRQSLVQAKTKTKYNIYKNKNRKQCLKMKHDKKQKQQNQKPKVSYYQYSHFIVPIYKKPGNAWATIFVPIFMLALLSISIFMHVGTLSDKIGSIATFVLGFIALIPSIKDELPPSQQITFSEIVIYIQALNCMLGLASSWFTSGRKNYNVWSNPIFHISLFIHFCCFAVALFLLYLHTFWWQKHYNLHNKAQQISPIDDLQGWNNPYCDQTFLRYNSQLSSYSDNKKTLIKVYIPEQNIKSVQ